MELCNLPIFQKIKKSDCCGCEVCKNICPKNIVDFYEDEEGFRYPIINKNECIGCNACVNVCPAVNHNISHSKTNIVYAGYSKDEQNVKSSSSGGIFLELAKIFLKLNPNGWVCGVVWNSSYEYVYHFVGNELNDLQRMKGSKYIQSRKEYIYRQIKQLLDKDKVLFVGTACEVVALKRFLKGNSDNLFTVDLVCKGPCSEKAYIEFKKDLEARYKSNIEQINMREVGWKTWIPQWIKVTFSNKKIYKRVFYTTDLGRAFYLMQRPACAQCRYSGTYRESDVTLGDFHGADRKKAYYNPNGTSIILVNTVNGNYMVDALKEKCKLIRVDYQEVVAENPCIEKPMKQHADREKFVKLFIEKGVHYAAQETYPFKEKIVNRMSPDIAQFLYKCVQKMKCMRKRR